MHSTQHPCESQRGTGLTELTVTPNLCPQKQMLAYKLCKTEGSDIYSNSRNVT